MTLSKNTTFVITATDPETNETKYLHTTPRPSFTILYHTLRNGHHAVITQPDPKSTKHQPVFKDLKSAAHFSSKAQAKDVWNQYCKNYKFDHNYTNIKIKAITTETKQKTKTLETL